MINNKYIKLQQCTKYNSLLQFATFPHLLALVRIRVSNAKLSMRTVHVLKDSSIVSGILKLFSTTFITLLISSAPMWRCFPNNLTTVLQYFNTSLLLVSSSISNRHGINLSRINAILSMSGEKMGVNLIIHVQQRELTHQISPEVQTRIYLLN